MPVVINEFEVVSTPNAQTTPADAPPAGAPAPAAQSPADLVHILRHELDRQARVRAH